AWSMETRTRKRGGHRRRWTSPGRTPKSAGRRAGSSVMGARGAVSARALPGATGPRYFPVILTVTSSNRPIQDLAEGGPPVVFLFYKRYHQVTGARPGTISATLRHAAFFGRGSP